MVRFTFRRNGRISSYLVLSLLALLLILPGGVGAQGPPGQQRGGDTPPPKPPPDVSFEQRLNEQVPLDTEFIDEEGRSVALASFFKDKPVVLAMGYYECPMLCSLVRKGMVDGLAKVTLNVGSDYEVVYVSIDPTETPMNAANTKAAVVSSYGREGSEAGWHFLTGTKEAIDRLANAIGFVYVYDAEIDQYAHAAGMVMATPSGKIARYFYGIEYNVSDLRLGLVEASANKIGSFVDQVLLLCYHYDPATGKYSGLVMTIIRVSFALFVVGLGFFVYWLSRSTPRGPTQAVG